MTGGAGFIGSHLVDHLLAGGHRVLALDDLSTGSTRNVIAHSRDSRFELVVGSVLDRAVLLPLVERSAGVFHLAAAVGVRLVMESPTRTIETNVLGTVAVIEAATAAEKPVLITSSSEVYGKSSKVPFAEDDDLVFGSTRIGRWSYGCSKAIDEYLALAFARERGLRVVIARLFNTVGPRQTDRYGMVLPTFVRQALRGEPLTIHGDGTQRRCFCDVVDVVTALVQLLAHPQSAGEVFNLGSDEEVTIAELAERIRVACDSSSPIVRVPYAEVWDEGFEDMQRRIPDLGRARSLIAFAPSRSLDEIIAAIVAQEREHLTSTG